METLRVEGDLENQIPQVDFDSERIPIKTN